MRMARHALNKDRWTLTFDPILKSTLLKEARKLRIYPVQLLETIVREKLNTFGFQSVRDSVNYVNALRGKSQALSNKKFLNEIKKWEKE
ncbi:MAG TPA: hypothetical protein DDW49_00430 [Deltaproteobacteria bacterium]|nr:MAG: hypothetical protein A2048_10465 [Deltaproteobacteria bacterium GWA2_45_12]HBF11852.1 hypothetical protein [Deltaproteobacteria bacterium]